MSSSADVLSCIVLSMSSVDVFFFLSGAIVNRDFPVEHFFLPCCLPMHSWPGFLVARCPQFCLYRSLSSLVVLARGVLALFVVVRFYPLFLSLLRAAYCPPKVFPALVGDAFFSFATASVPIDFLVKDGVLDGVDDSWAGFSRILCVGLP